jgi:plasmid stabilization system protein ParE
MARRPRVQSVMCRCGSSNELRAPSATPLLGRARDDLLAGVRSIAVHPTVVFYRIGKETIQVVRVVDGRRNLAAVFPGEEA